MEIRKLTHHSLEDHQRQSETVLYEWDYWETEEWKYGMWRLLKTQVRTKLPSKRSLYSMLDKGFLQLILSIWESKRKVQFLGAKCETNIPEVEWSCLLIFGLDDNIWIKSYHIPLKIQPRSYPQKSIKRPTITVHRLCLKHKEHL